MPAPPAWSSWRNSSPNCRLGMSPAGDRWSAHHLPVLDNPFPACGNLRRWIFSNLRDHHRHFSRCNTSASSARDQITRHTTARACFDLPSEIHSPVCDLIPKLDHIPPTTAAASPPLHRRDSYTSPRALLIFTPRHHASLLNSILEHAIILPPAPCSIHPNASCSAKSAHACCHYGYSAHLFVAFPLPHPPRQ